MPTRTWSSTCGWTRNGRGWVRTSEEDYCTVNPFSSPSPTPPRPRACPPPCTSTPTPAARPPALPWTPFPSSSLHPPWHQRSPPPPPRRWLRLRRQGCLSCLLLLVRQGCRCSAATIRTTITYTTLIPITLSPPLPPLRAHNSISTRRRWPTPRRRSPRRRRPRHPQRHQNRPTTHPPSCPDQDQDPLRSCELSLRPARAPSRPSLRPRLPAPGARRHRPRCPRPRSSSSRPAAQMGTTTNSTAGQRHHPNIVPAGGPPTPRLSNSSSSASSIPAPGSGSLSASTSLTAASPPLTNATSSSGFVSPFARPGTRPMAGLAFAGVPVGNGHQHGQLQGSTSGSVVSNRGSMILYRLSASEDGMLSSDGGARTATNGAAPGGPPPPVYGATMRHSAFYSETDSLTLDDSKYPPFPNGSNGTSASASRLPTPRGSVLGLSAGPPGSPGSPGGPPIGTSPLTLGMRSSANELASLGRAHGGLVAYVYDPDDDEDEDDDDYEDDYYGGDKKAREEKRMEDWVHDPTEVNALYAGVGKLKKAPRAPPPAPLASVGRTGKPTAPGAPPPGAPLRPGHPQQRAPYRPPPSAAVSLRGLVNVTTLVALILALLCLFIVLPVAKAFTDNGVELKILANTRINATGQAERRELGGKERREWRVDFGQER
ncbi:hypothetical protein BJ912DRAFT_980734 [Pholiota molesta]|nr:hypothetical protein BJ912DRAFT_980734 [Pholiota molesta]